ncbi:hypothetical protein GHT06_018697 [Daphnia sinensis]|uniref:Uncharacterized protein n=1 Tax=Daphnia sinensis TaxID=1820382 RepID=A0AAD5PTF4_9CRUS|nr:hypothetical protein GHT06_018697 [Daphnia sinensis]
MAILNARPLTHLSVHPEEESPLTPNHFLRGGAHPHIPPDLFDEDGPLSRKRWKQAQENLPVQASLDDGVCTVIDGKTEMDPEEPQRPSRRPSTHRGPKCTEGGVADGYGQPAVTGEIFAAVRRTGGFRPSG